MKIEINKKYQILTSEKKGSSNYELSLQVFDGKKLIGGTIIKNDSTPTEIFKEGMTFIKNYESPEKTNLERILFHK